MQPTRNTLSENIRAQSVELLNKHLAASIDLHAQVKQAHWNVRGPSFIAIHELFDKVSIAVEDSPTCLAERAGGLGGTAEGTVQIAAERRSWSLTTSASPTRREHVFAVAGALAAFGQSTREAVTKATDFGDADTADLFTEISRGIDQQLWFVESARRADARAAQCAALIRWPRSASSWSRTIPWSASCSARRSKRWATKSAPSRPPRPTR